MIAELLRRLTAPDPQPLPDTDARLALAALLVRIARADGQYDDSEIERIDRILAARHGLSGSAAAGPAAEAEALEAEAPDTVRFTKAIKDAWPMKIAPGWSRRCGRWCWPMGCATAMRMRCCAWWRMLGVNDRDSNLIRKRVEQGT